MSAPHLKTLFELKQQQLLHQGRSICSEPFLKLRGQLKRRLENLASASQELSRAYLKS